MTYYLDLFTPETWEAFRAHGSKISGYREAQRRIAEKVEPGDIFLCYLVRLSRWCGALEVTSKLFIDDAPIFQKPDPFVCRFKVKPRVVLSIDKSIPIFEPSIWNKISLTAGLERKIGWAQSANLRASLRSIPAGDGKVIEKALLQQKEKQKHFSFSPVELSRLASKRTIRAANRDVVVEVPHPAEDNFERPTKEEARASHRVQADIAAIGAAMGFRIWIPPGDRQTIKGLLGEKAQATLLEKLPLNYDGTTLQTIEQIDVIWIKNRSMARAFEVEHTTAVYSGLLRMADLLALQPNMDIRLHIVAPIEKRTKVLRELKRPVFSLLDKGPLYESCSYLPYDAIGEIAKLPYLEHTSDSVLGEYEELAQDE